MATKLEINQFEFNEWVERELCALKIQRLFRRWKASLYSKRKWKLSSRSKLPRFYCSFATAPSTSGTTSVPISSLVITNHQSNALFQECFQNIARQQHNNQPGTTQYFHIWRMILEMKKTYPNVCTDILFKALIETNGDYSKALLLLSDSNFIFSFRQPTLTHALRQQFLPHFNVTTSTTSRKKISAAVSSSSAAYSRNNNNSSASSSTATSNVNVIRNLRSKHLQEQQQQQNQRDQPTPSSSSSSKKELIDHILKVIEKTYFPYPIVSNVHNPASSIYNTTITTIPTATATATATTTTSLPPPLRLTKPIKDPDPHADAIIMENDSQQDSTSSSSCSNSNSNSNNVQKGSVEGGNGSSKTKAMAFSVKFAPSVITHSMSGNSSVASNNSSSTSSQSKK